MRSSAVTRAPSGPSHFLTERFRHGPVSPCQHVETPNFRVSCEAFHVHSCGSRLLIPHGNVVLRHSSEDYGQANLTKMTLIPESADWWRCFRPNWALVRKCTTTWLAPSSHYAQEDPDICWTLRQRLIHPGGRASGMGLLSIPSHFVCFWLSSITTIVHFVIKAQNLVDVLVDVFQTNGCKAIAKSPSSGHSCYICSITL